MFDDDLPDFDWLTPHAPQMDATQWRGEIEFYSQGSCHVFALAAASLWPQSFEKYLAILNPDEASWINPADPDDIIEVVVHVYAVFRTPAGPVALDIFGLRPEAQARKEAGERYAVGPCASEEELSEFLLRSCYIDRDEADDPASGFRPLHEVEDQHLAEARRLLEILHPGALIYPGQSPAN